MIRKRTTTTNHLERFRSRGLEVVEREGFEPSKAYAARFTVWSLWPLGYLSAASSTQGNPPGFIPIRSPKTQPLQHPFGVEAIRFFTDVRKRLVSTLGGRQIQQQFRGREARKMELKTGLEPVTYGLQNRCSTN